MQQLCNQLSNCREPILPSDVRMKPESSDSDSTSDEVTDHEEGTAESEDEVEEPTKSRPSTIVG